MHPTSPMQPRPFELTARCGPSPPARVGRAGLTCNAEWVAPMHTAIACHAGATATNLVPAATPSAEFSLHGTARYRLYDMIRYVRRTPQKPALHRTGNCTAQQCSNRAGRTLSLPQRRGQCRHALSCRSFRVTRCSPLSLTHHIHRQTRNKTQPTYVP